jgi:Ala-tRNA(Pro) deacylase
MIPRSVEAFLNEQQLPYSVLHHRPAYTAQEEAAVAHVPGWQWAKTIVCMADDQPILAVVPAPALVDLDRLRAMTGANDVRLASESEFARLYRDCEVGAIPPLGPLYGQQVFIDRALPAAGAMVFEAGSHVDAIRVNYDDFARVVHPTVGNIGRMRATAIEH